MNTQNRDVNRETALNTLLSLESSARDEGLAKRAELLLCDRFGDSDSATTDIEIGHSVLVIADRMRRLDNRGFIRRIIDKTDVSLAVVEDESSEGELLEMRGVGLVQLELIGGESVADGFTLQVPRVKASDKEGLVIARKITNQDQEVIENVGLWGITARHDRLGITNVDVMASHDPQAFLRRMVHARNLLKEYEANHPWLDAFRVEAQGTNLAVGVKLDGQLQTLQTLVDGQDADRATVIDEMNAQITAQHKWNYSDGESQHVALGVLLGVKADLNIK